VRLPRAPGLPLRRANNSFSSLCSSHDRRLNTEVVYCKRYIAINQTITTQKHQNAIKLTIYNQKICGSIFILKRCKLMYEEVFVTGGNDKKPEGASLTS